VTTTDKQQRGRELLDELWFLRQRLKETPKESRDERREIRRKIRAAEAEWDSLGVLAVKWRPPVTYVKKGW
jgi:hypothetical protein